MKWGVGGLNIDECRVGNSGGVRKVNIQANSGSKTTNFGCNGDLENIDGGRFPANLILTYEQMTFDEVCGGFPYTKSNKSEANYEKTKQDNTVHLYTNIKSETHFEDSGSACRYFYCAKASKKDRDEGLDQFEEKKFYSNLNTKNGSGERLDGGKTPIRKNIHPTVKPTELMQYLVRLVTPENGIILDPFMGSGSTGKACMYENLERNKNYSFIGIEKEQEYYQIAEARIEYVERKLNNEMY